MMCNAVVDLPDPPFSLPTTTTCAFVPVGRGSGIGKVGGNVDMLCMRL
jgi:hypothetical protein